MKTNEQSTTGRPSGISTAQSIAEVIRARIMRGEYKPRRHIPSQAAMTAEFRTSGRIISRAIADLRNRRYVWTLPHKGSYARPPEDWLNPGSSEP